MVNSYKNIKVHCPQCGEMTSVSKDPFFASTCQSCGYKWNPRWSNEKGMLDINKLPFKSYWDKSSYAMGKTSDKELLDKIGYAIWMYDNKERTLSKTINYIRSILMENGYYENP